MRPGSRVELILHDRGHLIGYYQYSERATVYISMDSRGMFTYGVDKKEIKKTIEL